MILIEWENLSINMEIEICLSELKLCNYFFNDLIKYL